MENYMLLTEEEKTSKEKNKDICFITNKDLRAKIYRAILVEYQIYKNFYEISRY